MARVQDSFGLIGTVLDGKFRVERAVAEGGFAVVYAGTHTTLQRTVAIKVLKRPRGLDDAQFESFMESFASEARAIVKINHPHIVQVLDFGVSSMPSRERAPWMVMEWLDGRTLREDLLERRGRGGRSPGEAYAIVRPILEALAYAHDEGIAHRDIKPSNIMMVPTRRGTVMKLVDFGIAKEMNEEEQNAEFADVHTKAQFQAFSLNYATPEQVGQTRTGPWTDVHAIALVLTELLLGKQVLSGGNRAEILGRIVGPQRPTPASFGVDVGGPLEQVLSTAMALRPADRFASAGAMLTALDGAISNTNTELVSGGIVQFGRATGTFAAFGAGDTTGNSLGNITGNTTGNPLRSGPHAAMSEPTTGSGVTGPTGAPPKRSVGVIVGAALGVALALGAGVGLVIRNTGSASGAASSGRSTSATVGSSAVASAVTSASAAATSSVAPSAAADPSAVALPTASALASASASALEPTVAPSAEPARVVARATPPAAAPSARPRPARPPVRRPRSGDDPEVD